MTWERFKTGSMKIATASEDLLYRS